MVLQACITWLWQCHLLFQSSWQHTLRQHHAWLLPLCLAWLQVPVEVNPELLQQLTGMGFAETRAARGLHFSGNSTLEVRGAGPLHRQQRRPVAGAQMRQATDVAGRLPFLDTSSQ